VTTALHQGSNFGVAPSPAGAVRVLCQGCRMQISTGWPREVEDLLARARALTPGEIRTLAAGYGDARFGDARERRGLVDQAVRHADAASTWRGLGDEAARAGRESAASRTWALTRLSLLFDAELATADAALVALFPERFPDEVAARIAGPWRRVACG
jgi:hypothetical protein